MGPDLSDQTCRIGRGARASRVFVAPPRRFACPVQAAPNVGEWVANSATATTSVLVIADDHLLASLAWNQCWICALPKMPLTQE
jgi:hypothetical protein